MSARFCAASCATGGHEHTSLHEVTRSKKEKPGGRKSVGFLLFLRDSLAPHNKSQTYGQPAKKKAPEGAFEANCFFTTY
jgi:hypothetical protein